MEQTTTNNPSPFSSLPHEGILHIFSFLKAKDLYNLTSVSQLFKGLAEDDFLWRPIAKKREITKLELTSFKDSVKNDHLSFPNRLNTLILQDKESGDKPIEFTYSFTEGLIRYPAKIAHEEWNIISNISKRLQPLLTSKSFFYSLLRDSSSYVLFNNTKALRIFKKIVTEEIKRKKYEKDKPEYSHEQIELSLNNLFTKGKPTDIAYSEPYGDTCLGLFPAEIYINPGREEAYKNTSSSEEVGAISNKIVALIQNANLSIRGENDYHSGEDIIFISSRGIHRYFFMSDKALTLFKDQVIKAVSN
jgi:F-box-like